MLEVVEIISRMDEMDGITRPFKCRCNDNKTYVVKGLPSMPRQDLINEWVSANIAKSIGLSIPDFALVYVDPLVSSYGLHDKQLEGIAFASEYIEHSRTISYNQAHSKVDVESQKTIYLFDYLVKNTDRCLSELGGNVNILFDESINQHYIIDHNQAFYFNAKDQDFIEHVYSIKNRSWNYDLVNVNFFSELFENVKDVIVNSYNDIPNEWLLDGNDNEDYIDNAIRSMSRIFDEKFWENIK